MQINDLPEFKECLELVMSFYGKEVTPAVMGVWRSICQPFTIEQIKKAFNTHVANPENGQFAPKPADIVRILQGTKTDKSVEAWAKVMEAIQRAGSYRDVVFDDPAIHASIEDMGGWLEICRTKTDELSYAQHRFSEAHKAYSIRNDYPFPPMLCGASSEASVWESRGMKKPKPVMVGNLDKCHEVLKLGNSTSGRVHLAINLVPEMLKLSVETAA